MDFIKLRVHCNFYISNISLPNIDTIFSTADGSYYVFKSADYWKMSEDSIQLKRKIRDDWPGLPDNIDAAFMWNDNNKTYFFKG